MGTTREEIGGWFDRGVAQKATHLIVVVDDFDHEDYPVFFTCTREGALAKVDEYSKGMHSMQRVMEVYALTLPKDPQLSEHRSFNYDVAAPAPVSRPRKSGPSRRT